MFARNASLRLKPNTLSEFTRIFDKDVIPMLRKQSGFRDEVTFAVPGRRRCRRPQPCQATSALRQVRRLKA
jgi:hypothetical protein